MKASELKIESQARRTRNNTQEPIKSQKDQFFLEKRAFNRIPLRVAPGSADLPLIIPKEGDFKDQIYLLHPDVFQKLNELGVEGVSEFTVFLAQTLSAEYGIIPVSTFSNSWTDSQYEAMLAGQKDWIRMVPNLTKEEYTWLKWNIDREPSWFGTFDEMLDTITEGRVISNLDHPVIAYALYGSHAA